LQGTHTTGLGDDRRHPEGAGESARRLPDPRSLGQRTWDFLNQTLVSET